MRAPVSDVTGVWRALLICTYSSTTGAVRCCLSVAESDATRRPGRSAADVPLATAMDAGARRPRPAAHAVLGASVATLAGALPVFLLGGLAVQVGADLGLGPGLLGLLVSGYFAASALAAAPVGRLAERAGPRRTVRTGAVLALVSLLGVATAAGGPAGLGLLLLLGGVANAAGQLGANGSLARSVPRRRQGLAFAVKQVAVPTSSLLAGLAVPALALTVGWRWAFAAAALVAVAALVVAVPDGARPGGDAATGSTTSPPPARRPGRGAAPAGPGPGDVGLVRLAAVGALGSGAAGALTTFLVTAAVAVGVGPGRAGLLLALGSGLGVAARLGAGLAVDRLTARGATAAAGGAVLRLVAVQLGSGALGFGLLVLAATTGSTTALVAGAVVAFAAGWSWPGVLNAAVVRLVPDAPSAATGVTQTGVFAGAAAGPLVAGLLVEAAGFGLAWSAAAVAQAAACLLLLRRAPASAPSGRGTVARVATRAAVEEVP